MRNKRGDGHRLHELDDRHARYAGKRCLSHSLGKLVEETGGGYLDVTGKKEGLVRIGEDAQSGVDVGLLSPFVIKKGRENKRQVCGQRMHADAQMELILSAAVWRGRERRQRYVQ